MIAPFAFIYSYAITKLLCGIIELFVVRYVIYQMVYYAEYCKKLHWKFIIFCYFISSNVDDKIQLFSMLNLNNTQKSSSDSVPYKKYF